MRLSTRHIAARVGNISHQTVATWLRRRKFSLRSNVKRLAGSSHPDRDRQFKLIRKARTRFLNAGWPVLSVDAKNAELIGDYKNSGRKWEAPDKPELVKTHDFKTKTTIKAIPYGIYDIGRNEGHVEVGTSRNTGRFAADAIRSWWYRKGKKRYPKTPRLAIECDGGGSNGHRPWLWKRQMQKLSDDTGLIITVHHYPPGASKWNPVEHRLLGVIARNWAAIPLRDKETLTSLLRGTETTTGLGVTARWNDRVYKTGEKVTKDEREALNFKRHGAMPLWNYTFYPRK